MTAIGLWLPNIPPTFIDSVLILFIQGKPPIENGQVDYKAFAHLITTGAAEELAKA